MAGASKNLTFDLLARDAGAGAAMLKLAAQMEALNREMKRVSGSGDNVDRSFRKTTASAEKTNRGLSALLTTAVALGPALIPIGTVAVAALAGVAPAAGVAALAFLGLRRAWKDGTLQATQLGKTITVFRGELTKLEYIAAGGVTKGLNQGLKSLQPLFPALERSTALFASQLGGIASHVAPGLAQMFLQLMPLFQTFGDLLVKGSEKFQQWATSGNGIKNFVAYAQTQLPAVLETLKSLVITVSHVAQGFAPFGSTSLMALRILSQAINAIPIGVLQALIPVLAGATLGFKAFREAQVASSALQAFSTKLGTSTGIARGASGIMGTLGKAVGFLGVAGIGAGLALGGLSLVMGRNKQAAIENQRRINDLTQAIMDGAAAMALYTQLQKSGAVKAGSALGIDPKQLVDAARGVTDLSNRLKDLRADQATANEAASAAAQKFGAASAEYQSAQAYAKNFGNEVSTVSSKLQQAQANFAAAQKNVAEYAAAQGDAALSGDILSGKVQQTAGNLGLATDAYISGKLAVDKKTAADAAQTAAMQLEGDAAGLLTAKLQILNDVLLGASDANLAFKLANLQLQDQLKATKGDLSQTTQAGIQNNQAVNQGIKLAEQDGEALAKSEQKRLGLAKATADGTARTLTDLQALRASIVAVHGNTSAVDEYIRKLGGVPGKKPTQLPNDAKPRKADVDHYKDSINGVPPRRGTTFTSNASAEAANVAALRAQIEGLRNRTLSIDITQTIRTVGGTAFGGHLATRAAGGPVLAGTAYIVGERRPEVFVPDRNGRIIPNVADSKAVLMPEGAAGGGLSAADIGQAVSRAVAAELAGASFVFDGDGLARLVTRRQNAIAGKGTRR